ncbi:glycosyltransferase family 2 protein [Gammaproteobacteria bacterium]|nr:glycosyltransferase family 2 protein [Gammaproteobacteria bacterium]
MNIVTKNESPENIINISIVIPVFNSEKILSELCNQIENSLEALTFELILINDQSKDRSWEKIKELSVNKSYIKGINLRKNSGQDNAIFAGIQTAIGKYIVIMDDDLQHSPSDIPSLYNQIEQGFDVCYANFQRKKQALWKNLGSWLNGKLAEVIIQKPKNIYLSPFKIIRKSIIEEVVKTNYLYPYIDGILFSITNNITQIEVKHNERHSGESNYTLFESIKVFLKLATGFSIFPLRLASIGGAIISLIGFLLSFYYIVEYFIFKSSPEGFTTIIVVLLILGGVVLMSLGILGEYLGRIYLSINKNKSFSVKETTY